MQWLISPLETKIGSLALIGSFDFRTSCSLLKGKPLSLRAMETAGSYLTYSVEPGGHE